MGTNKRIVMYNCPFCSERYDRKDLVTHITDNHEDELPKDFTPLRYVFNYVNKKPLTYHGKCTECRKSTPWDENKGRYDRQCGSKACHDSYVKKFEENMMKTRGTTRISSTAEGQKKMLANRKISGTYTWSDGTKKTYTGSYELKALEFMDKVLNIKSDDILCPGPILEYGFQGKTHIYITDFYYQPYNLVIEVKDGGNNPNKRNMPDYRAKQIAKEQFIIKHTNYNYLRLTNNNLSQLLAVFADLKYQLVENTGDRVIHVNESLDVFDEYMNALMTGKVVGLRDTECVYMKPLNPGNNVFSGISDSSFDKIIRRNKDGVLEESAFDDNESFEVFRCNLPYEVTVESLSKNINKEVDKDFIHESAFGSKEYIDDTRFEAEYLGIFEQGMFLDKYYLENRYSFLESEDNTEIISELSEIKENIERMILV